MLRHLAKTENELSSQLSFLCIFAFLHFCIFAFLHFCIWTTFEPAIARPNSNKLFGSRLITAFCIFAFWLRRNAASLTSPSSVGTRQDWSELHSALAAPSVRLSLKASFRLSSHSFAFWKKRPFFRSKRRRKRQNNYKNVKKMRLRRKKTALLHVILKNWRTFAAFL